MMEAAVNLHAATTGLLLALAKTLEEAGSMKIKDFEANVRMVAEMMLREKSEPVAALMVDFADQLFRDPEPPVLS